MPRSARVSTITSSSVVEIVFVAVVIVVSVEKIVIVVDVK